MTKPLNELLAEALTAPSPPLDDLDEFIAKEGELSATFRAAYLGRVCLSVLRATPQATLDFLVQEGVVERAAYRTVSKDGDVNYWPADLFDTEPHPHYGPSVPVYVLKEDPE